MGCEPNALTDASATIENATMKALKSTNVNTVYDADNKVGIKRDYAMAYDLFLKAAKSGCSCAYNNLGLYHELGLLDSYNADDSNNNSNSNNSKTNTLKMSKKRVNKYPATAADIAAQNTQEALYYYSLGEAKYCV